MKQNRRKSRRTAFELLFAWSFQEDDAAEALEREEAGGELALDDFSRALFTRTLERLSDIDALIESHSDRWKLNRLSKVTLAALRLAFCELSFFEDIPAGVTINEAVEIVKSYGTEDEASYVNGILGTYERGRTAAGGEA